MTSKIKIRYFVDELEPADPPASGCKKGAWWRWVIAAPRARDDVIGFSCGPRREVERMLQKKVRELNTSYARRAS